ncbi:MAG: FHA domain-containing protein [Chloroflexi bacterium]|nr:FHA domain-containing protein [Chloroflexota bacterium]
MATLDQLEIISVDGLIEFYDLDPTKGVTSIGRHPDNDIILDSPGIALFHAMLDHRQKPYHFLLLSHDESTSLAGRLLPANTSSPLQNWDNIQLEGYTLILMEGAGPIVTPGPPPVVAPAPPSPRPTTPARPPTGSQPTRPTGFTPPTTRPETLPLSSYAAPKPLSLPAPATSAPQPVASLTALPPDHTDERIMTELTGREWTIDVERIATFQLTIINGGDIVAMFVVSIEGLDESWVTISQPQINLNEGERATVTIALTAPRLPTSRAGTHHFAIVVTSPNYPSRYSQRGATLIINPYYEFAVGELSPKQQTISWFKRSGQVTVFIANKGNSNAPFRLDGAENERACSFEFQVPGEAVGLAQQAELRLPSEESIAIPVRVTPLTRRLISLRKRTYAFTITTTMIEGQQTPRSLLGQLSQKPLIGPWILALLTCLLLVLLAYIFRPQTREFTINNQINPVVIEAGTPVKLSWSASFLSNVSVECKTATDCPLAGRVPGPAATMMAQPTGDAVYVLRARNLLSEIPMVGPAWFQPSLESPPVFVTPVKPLIRLFTVDDEDRAILTGQSVNLSWEVLNADEVTLQTNSAPEKLRSDQFTSQRAVSPAIETTYTLVARNRYGDDTQSITLKVNVPTPTPVPTPAVKKFIVNPLIIIAGTPVVVEWEVEGADVVRVQPIGDNLPASQTLSQSPQQNITYILNAARGSAAIQPIAIQVFVTPPPPEPGAPEIVFFEADPVQLIQGKATPSDDEKELTLKWLDSHPHCATTPAPPANACTQADYLLLQGRYSPRRQPYRRYI